MLRDQIKDAGYAIASWLRKEFFYKKMISPIGIPLLLLLALVCGFLVYKDLIMLPFGLAAALIGIAVVYYCLFRPLQGFYLITVISFFIFYPSHLVGKDLPIASVVDLLFVFLFLGSMILKKTKAIKEGNLFNTPVSLMLLVNIIMFLLEAFNPNVPNISGWTTPIRRLLVLVIVYVVTYRLIDEYWKFKKFLRLWLALAFIAALYACYQQWVGYLPSEIKYIMSRPGEYELLFQGGQFRKFSFLSDVVTFGIMSGSMAVLTIILAISEESLIKRIILFGMALAMLLGMAYSGTRTTNIILPAGITLYGFITIQNKKTIIALFASFLLFLFILFAPIYSNPTLNRMRTTFDSKEQSLNVREVNRHFIQPYLHYHPIGGGVSSTGVEGVMFYPSHPLAGFPPDSGLLKIGLEMGWIGLILHLLLNATILLQGIYYYFRMKNKKLKVYMVAILCSLFPFMVCQFSQNAIGQIPSALYFYSCMAIIKRLKEFDEEGISMEEETAGEKRPLLLFFK